MKINNHYKINSMIQNHLNILKLNWERGVAPAPLSQQEVENAVADYTSQRVVSFDLFSKGCANSNFEIRLIDKTICVLRVYTRDPKSLCQEYHIHQLIQDKVPVPRFLHVNHECKIIPYPFAIMEYAEGCLFRDVIIEGNKDAITSCSYQAGKISAQIASFQFEKAGFFESDLTVKSFGKGETFSHFIYAFLSNPHIVLAFGNELIERIHALIDKHQALIDEISHHSNLTHADYDPSNILVKREKNGWKISAILDWEFALSSTIYMDIGLMLRYAHKLPPFFQNSFIQGIKDSNPSLLDQNWEVRAKLVDILCLLSLCASSSFQKRPIMFEDIKALFIHTCGLPLTRK